ncbi:site-specific integrase, partial [Shigella sonnei]
HRALSEHKTLSISWSHYPVREYVVRLRRLGNHLHEQNISLDQLQDGFLDEILAPWLPTTSTNNYRIALRKYQHYQRQTCT